MRSAYNNRGSARSDKGETDGALDGLRRGDQAERALRVGLFQPRQCLRGEGRYARALKDYDAAIKYNRRNVNAYIARGALLLAERRDREGARRHAAGGGARPQERLRGAVARDRGAARQAEGCAGGGKGLKDLDMKGWPAPVLPMFGGETKADAVIAAADNPDATVKAAHTCEANFYGGEYALIGGNREEAMKLFQRGREGLPARLPRGDRGGGRVEGDGEGGLRRRSG